MKDESLGIQRIVEKAREYLMEQLMRPLNPEESGIAANLIINEILPRCKKKGIDIKDSPVPPGLVHLAAIHKTLGITNKQIRMKFDKLFE